MIKSMKRGCFIACAFLLLLVGCVPDASTTTITITSDQIVQVGCQMVLRSNVDSVVWSSDNEEIATIDQNGIVTGVSIGIATIRVQSVSDATLFATRQITVISGNDPDCPTDPNGCEPGKICPTLSYLPPRDLADVEVKLGIDRIDDYLDLFADKRVGLITNHTGINSDYISTIDILFEKVNLVALFAPEHGIRGNLQAGQAAATYIDEKTGLTVYSLYGSTYKPTPAMLSNVDILCIDLQDAGARFYTYIYTMAYAMEACKENGKEFVVFDRPNPASGAEFEGNILQPAYSSFVGLYPIVQRHGMTMAELAYMFNEEFGIECDLHVILMDGWGRYMYMDDTNLPWVIPSPNFPSVETALVYPGTCIFEGTNLSEGRGTTIPFQVVGAPYINADELAEALNDLGLEGVVFRPAYFTPTFSKHTNQLCRGVQVHVTDRMTFKAVKTGWAMLEVVRDLYPDDFAVLNATSDRNMMNLLTGVNYISRRTYTLEQQFAILEADTATFGIMRDKYLLYVEVTE